MKRRVGADSSGVATVELEHLSWFAMRSLWVEAHYYRIPELARQSEEFQFTVGLWSRLTKVGFSPRALLSTMRVGAAGIGLFAAWLVKEGFIKEAPTHDKGHDGESSNDDVSRGVSRVVAAVNEAFK